MFSDLHLHSWYSDGSLSPAQIVREASDRNVSLIAVTDHDVLEGSRELEHLAGAAGLSWITGVELDAQDFDVNFHILGYGMNLNDPAFCEFTRENRVRLEEVNRLLICKLESDHEAVSLEDYRQFQYDRSKGGWKALHYLEARGVVPHFKQGLSVYAQLHHDYTCAHFPSVREIVTEIHNAGGKAILAHPGKVLSRDNIQLFEEKLDQVMMEGVDGIECWYPCHTDEITQCCLAYCHERNLLITSGSDCHGSFERTMIGECEISETLLNLNGIRIIRP